jgi:hypothetical protein
VPMAKHETIEIGWQGNFGVSEKRKEIWVA